MTQVFYEHTLEQAALLLKQGALVAFPTETVYGLGAPIFSEESVRKIFEVKRRPVDNPLIAHIQSLIDIEKIAIEIPNECYVLAEKFFPGPLTIVLKKAKQVPDIVSRKTIAFRMPKHPLALKLIELVGEPLVAPSANLSGRPSPTRGSHVLADLNGKIAGVIEGGQCQVGIESTVISLCDPKRPLLLRAGTIDKEEIEGFLKCNIELAYGSTQSPGTRYRHYAPEAKVYLFESEALLKLHIESYSCKRKVAIPTEQNLYFLLREADDEKCQEICLLCTHSSMGLRDRLMKASQK